MAATVTSGIKFRYKKESTFGTAPTGAYQEANITGETLQPNITTATSNVIRPDGQINAVVRTDAEGGGPVNGELEYGMWDDWMESVLLSEAWQTDATDIVGSSNVNIAVATTARGTDGVPAVFSGAGVSASGGPSGNGWAQGMWGKTSAFGATRPFKVIGASATQLHVAGNTSLGAQTGVTLTLSQLEEVTNGITNATYACEREDSDDTDEFHQYLGVGVNGMTVEIPTAGFITTTWDLIGKVPTSAGTSLASSNTAAPTTQPMHAAQVLVFLEGDPELGDVSNNAQLWSTTPFQVLNARINMTPSLRTRKAVGTVGPALEHGRGDIAVSGSVQLYYNNASGADDKTLMDKVLNDTVSGLAFVVKDDSRNTYVIDLPRVKFTSGLRNAPAKSQDVILQLEFIAYRNPDDTNPNANVSGVTMRIARGVMNV